MAHAMLTEPRPTRLTAEGRLKAAITIARELAEARLIEASEVEESARDIAALEAGRFADGFEVAKRLEDRAGWDCNFAMAEVLDGYGHACGREIEAEERRWAERNDVQPPLPDGTRILFAPRDERGVIEGVSTYGVARKWIQRPPKASWVHFDIALSKKALALKAGAVLTDQFGPLEHEARLDIASGNLDRIARGEARLERIAFSRSLRSA